MDVGSVRKTSATSHSEFVKKSSSDVVKAVITCQSQAGVSDCDEDSDQEEFVQSEKGHLTHGRVMTENGPEHQMSRSAVTGPHLPLALGPAISTPEFLPVGGEVPCMMPLCYDSDWLVESLTPKLREFVLDHFQENFITEPKFVPSINKYVGARVYQESGSFISLFMRPQTVVGSDPSATMPVHYHIAKLDLLTFQRKAESNLDIIQGHLELFASTLRSLRSLITKGYTETDQINVMLPHSYSALDKSGFTVCYPLFPRLDGIHLMMVIDTSGAAGRHLQYVKAELNRALKAHMGTKASFQLVKFADGEPHLWAEEMMVPSEDSLRSASDWIDALTVSRGGRW